MKKYLAVILCLTLTASLLGCGIKTAQPTQTSTTAPKETQAPTQTVPASTDLVITQQPMVSVSLPITTETLKAEDGSDIFHYSCQNMSLVLPEAEIADKVIIDYLNRVDSVSSSVESIRASAKNHYVSGQDFIPYLYSISYSPMRIDQGVLSLAGAHITYSGGAHTDTTCTAANYDLTTGQVLTLGSILKHIDKKDALRELVLSALTNLAKDVYLYEDYKDTVNKRFEKDESTDEDWYFSDTGLCFYFSPYEIAPYSSGTIVAEVPYASLAGIIDDAYFPPERNVTSGKLMEVSFDSADLTQYTQIAELVFQKESAKTLYYTDKSIENFKISYPDPLTGKTTVVFATQHLTPGDAVMVEAPDEIKAMLEICYNEN